jgi:hypothetical protein
VERGEILKDVVRRYAGYNVPRYTSYPTVADFTTTVTATEHAAWLGRLDARESVSVYLHVPYCREICLYCGCNTKMAVRDDVVDMSPDMSAPLRRGRSRRREAAELTKVTDNGRGSSND